MRASQEGHIEVAKILLENGADVNAKKGGVMTAMHVALRGGHIDIATLLEKNGAKWE